MENWESVTVLDAGRAQKQENFPYLNFRCIVQDPGANDDENQQTTENPYQEYVRPCKKVKRQDVKASTYSGIFH